MDLFHIKDLYDEFQTENHHVHKQKKAVMREITPSDPNFCVVLKKVPLCLPSVLAKLENIFLLRESSGR